MDFAMKNIDTETDTVTRWNFNVKHGILGFVDHNEATEQRSFIATYLQRGTVPQVPSAGNQWVELMTGLVTPQELNAQIRQSIIDLTGGLSYMPKYKDVDGKVVVEVTKI
jgi:hypothetical protein